MGKPIEVPPDLDIKKRLDDIKAERALKRLIDEWLEENFPKCAEQDDGADTPTGNERCEP